MRIAIFSDNFFPELGGIQDSIIFLAKELALRNHRVSFYVPKPSERNYRLVHLPPRELDLGKNIEIHRFASLPYPSSSKQSRFVFPTFLRWLTVKNFMPDVLHTHTFFGVGFEALAAKKFLRIPLIGTNHWAIAGFHHYSLFTPHLFAKYSLRYVAWYYNHCDYVTTPSSTVLEELVDYGLQRPHEMVSNPIDTETFRPLSEKERQKIKKRWGLGEKTVVYAGRLGVEKRIDVALRAVALAREKLPDLTIAIAGHGAEEKKLRLLTRSLGIEGGVKFLGTLSWQKLNELYNASEAFVTASTSEVQPLTVMQAMASGLPAVSVAAYGLKDLVSAETGLQANPDDPGALAEKIVTLFRGESLRKKLSKNACVFAKRFSAPAIARRWEAIYRKVINTYNGDS